MNQVNPEDIESAQADDDAAGRDGAGQQRRLPGLQPGQGAVGQPGLPLAVAHAIDKQDIVDALYAGDAEAAKEMMPPGLWGYKADLEDYAVRPGGGQGLAGGVPDGREAAAGEGGVLRAADPALLLPQAQGAGRGDPGASCPRSASTPRSSRRTGAACSCPEVRDGKTDIFLLGWGGDNGDPDNFLCQFFCGGDAPSGNSDAEGNARCRRTRS